MKITPANMIAIRAFALLSRQALKKLANVLESSDKPALAKRMHQFAEMVAVAAFDIEQEYMNQEEVSV